MKKEHTDQRKDSVGSNSSTDLAIPPNLSMMSTTPTFSNVAPFATNDSSNEKCDNSSPVVHANSSIHHSSNTDTSSPSRPTTSSQPIPSYNQPIFSFSRMTSSQLESNTTTFQSTNIPLPTSIASNHVVNVANNGYNTSSSLAPSLNVPSFGSSRQETNAGSNIMSGRTGDASNNSNGGVLFDKRRCVLLYFSNLECEHKQRTF